MNQTAERSVLCLLPENEIEGLEDFRQKYILHPGKSVPFHITLLPNFLLPYEIDDEVIGKVTKIAANTSSFKFWAKPLSSFPLNKVLYLSPSPLTPIEALVNKLYKRFPDFRNLNFGYPVFHMTIALGNPQAKTEKIAAEYLARFGDDPLALQAGKLAIYSRYGDRWRQHLAKDLGKQE